MKRLSIAALVLAAAFLAAGSLALAADEKKAELKITFTPGTYVVTTTSDTENSSVIGDQDSIRQKTTDVMVMEYVISKPDAKGFKDLTMTYTGIKRVVNQGGRESSYDSAGPFEKQNSTMAMALKPLLNVKVSGKITPQNKIEGIKGLNDLWDGQVKAMPDQKDLFNQMRQSFNDEALTELFQKQGELLPKEAVAPGDAYDASVAMGRANAPQLIVDYKCKVESTKAGLTTIGLKGTGTVKMPATASAPADADAPKPPKVEMTLEGKFVFDATAGMISKQEMNQTTVTTGKAIIEEKPVDVTFVAKGKSVTEMVAKK